VSGPGKDAAAEATRGSEEATRNPLPLVSRLEELERRSDAVEAKLARCALLLAAIAGRRSGTP